MLGRIYGYGNMTYEIMDKTYNHDLGTTQYDVHFTNPDIGYSGRGTIFSYTFSKLSFIE
jgi:hypothetical protein